MTFAAMMALVPAARYGKFGIGWWRKSSQRTVSPAHRGWGHSGNDRQGQHGPDGVR